MPPLRPTPPRLATLHTKPSWHNRTGRPDRSGCYELRASTIWRSADFPSLTRANASSHHSSSRHSCEDTNPDQPQIPYSKSAAPTRPRCIATGEYTIYPHILTRLARSHNPRQLVGDHRTCKSNVMKSCFANRPGEPAVNPNKGPHRLKMLGVSIDDWSQTVIIQRWRFPLPPRYDPRADTMRPHFRIQHFVLCPRCKRKVCKLFLPQCTQEELRDAITAQQYANLLATHPFTRNKPLTKQDAAIITRYQAIFGPRHFICGPCLHIRYGEAKAQRRES